MNGFSFNGVHCNTYGCTYIPTAETKFVQPDIEVASSEIAGRDGGYFHSAKLKTRVFSLNCFFEDVTMATLYDIGTWLSKDAVGKLIFDDRPAVYYIVRPTSKFEPSIYGRRQDWMNQLTYSGTFTATFTAFSPFGYMEHTEYYDMDKYGESSYSGILCSEMMPPLPSPTDTSCLLYNCGTQPCDTVIEVCGRAPSGLTIRNISNGTSCVITTLPASGTIVIDGELGKTTFVNNGIESEAFEYHDEGYITLDSYGRIYRPVVATAKGGENKIYISGISVGGHLSGCHIQFENQWLKITDIQNDGAQVVSKTFESDSTEYTTITKMNEIEILGDDVEQNVFNIKYIPRVL